MAWWILFGLVLGFLLLSPCCIREITPASQLGAIISLSSLLHNFQIYREDKSRKNKEYCFSHLNRVLVAKFTSPSHEESFSLKSLEPASWYVIKASLRSSLGRQGKLACVHHLCDTHGFKYLKSSFFQAQRIPGLTVTHHVKTHPDPFLNLFNSIISFLRWLEKGCYCATTQLQHGFLEWYNDAPYFIHSLGPNY